MASHSVLSLLMAVSYGGKGIPWVVVPTECIALALPSLLVHGIINNPFIKFSKDMHRSVYLGISQWGTDVYRTLICSLHKLSSEMSSILHACHGYWADHLAFILKVDFRKTKRDDEEN